MVYYCDLCIHLHNYIQLHIQTHTKSTRPYGSISHQINKYIIDSDMYKTIIIMVKTKYIQRADGSPKQYM